MAVLINKNIKNITEITGFLEVITSTLERIANNDIESNKKFSI
jgi:hypothetical protein